MTSSSSRACVVTHACPRGSSNLSVLLRLRAHASRAHASRRSCSRARSAARAVGVAREPATSYPSNYKWRLRAQPRNNSRDRTPRRERNCALTKHVGSNNTLSETTSYLPPLLPRPGGASRGHDVHAGYSPGGGGSCEALSGPLGYRVVHFWLNRADRQTSRPRLGSAVWALALRRGGVA